MSYGTAAGVAAFTPRYANAANCFDGDTTPTLTSVTSWLAQVSAMLDVALAGYGATTPVTAAAVTPLLDGFTNAQVAGMVGGGSRARQVSGRPPTAG